MLPYNFGAFDSDSGDYSDEEQQDIPMTEEDKKRAEIKKLQEIRNQKRKQLMALSKENSNSDAEHQNKIKELSKQALKLSKSVENNRAIVKELEKKLETIPADPSLENQKPKSESEQQNEAIRLLRLQTDSLKTQIKKAKKALDLEGGNKNRANQILKLKQQLAELPVDNGTDDVSATRSNAPTYDIQELKNEVTQLQEERKNLKLKLQGLNSRVAVLEQSDLKSRILTNLDRSKKNDDVIELLKPKEKKKEPKRQYRVHIGQQSRQSVMIRGLHQELVERMNELNHNKIEKGETGITREIERMQKRLHLLESSMSCVV